MANNDEITGVQSFTERTLKYGRNLMVVAVPIIVFALVPVVDLAKSRPLNFAIQEGGEIWIWGILLALLLYYGFRFFGLAIPDFLEWRKHHGKNWITIKSELNNSINEMKTQIDALASARQTFNQASDDNQRTQWKNHIDAHEINIKSVQVNIRTARSELRDYEWRRAYFWVADAGLPTVLFGLALLASIDQISTLYSLKIPSNFSGEKGP